MTKPPTSGDEEIAPTLHSESAPKETGLAANAQIEHVGRKAVLAATDPLQEKLTPQQWAAFLLAAGVFVLIITTIALDFGMLLFHLPPEPKPPTQLSPAAVENYRILCEHYTVMTNAALERAIKIFETCIAAAFLPVFTGIIGYIFGRERP